MSYSSKRKVSNNSRNFSTSQREVSNTLIQGVQSVISRRKSPWVGTMTQLGQLLENKVSIPAILPGSPSALRVALNKVVRRLSRAGIVVRFSRDTSHMRTRLVELFVR